MTKRLLLAGGVLNAIFFLFHLLLGYQIARATEVAPTDRAVMAGLNVGLSLFVLLIAYASLVYSKELVDTGLGRLVLMAAALLYLSRAAEELFLFEFTAAIFGACALVGAVYLTLFVRAQQRARIG